MFQNLTIGLLGGSFNPAHEGHLHISELALKKLKLDYVWWLVSPQNPLKKKSDLAPYAKRFESAKRMALHPRIRVMDFEKNANIRYTVDTLLLMRKKYPKVKFVWLMGADNLAIFDKWYRWNLVAQLAPIVIFDRAPFSHTALRKKAALKLAKFRLPSSSVSTLKNRRSLRWAYLLLKRHPASSTAIRARKAS